MSANGAGNHGAGQISGIDAAIFLTHAQPEHVTRHLQFQGRVALRGANFAHKNVAVQVAVAGTLEQTVAVLHLNFLTGDLARLIRHIYFQPGRGNGTRPALLDFGHAHIRLVVPADHLHGRHLNSLDQLAFVGIDRIQPEDHLCFVQRRGAVAQRTQGVEQRQRPTPLALTALFALTRYLARVAVHALRLIHNQHWIRGPNQVNRLFAARLFVGAVNDPLGLASAA